MKNIALIASYRKILTLIGGVFLLLATSQVNAQTPIPRDCECSPLYDNSNFVKPVLIDGTELSVGAIYRFSDVFPSNPYGTTIDALVKIEEFTGGAGLLEIDVATTGLPEAFQPKIDSNNNGDQSVLFSITFVSGGGNYGDEVVISFFGSPFDIDGNASGVREYAEISLPDAYYISNNTVLDLTQTPTVVRGEALIPEVAPGGDVSLDPKYTFSNYFENKSSLTYRIGKVDANSDRYYSLDMNNATYEDPNSVLVTYPVICGNVEDLQGNPLANVTVDVTGSDGSNQTVTTDADGHYKAVAAIPDFFVNVDYEIVESDLSGYISVSDVDGANDNTINLTINVLSSCGNDFVDAVEPTINVDDSTDILCNGEATGSITVSSS
ncbi:MAG: carboxypeptidase-like regulatory domain-containing protein, partial [Bacteroidia bacterium]|nr:carboxypeptidase-like regulatory domain-containing protein [Bacteroidia bacterium]